MPRKVKQPAIDDDNPEWTKADFAAATKFPGGVRLKDLKPGTLARVQGTRGAQKAPTKIPVSIRLSPEVVNHFKKKVRAGSPGSTTPCARSSRRQVDRTAR